MKEWKLDFRTSGDILRHIGEIEANYTPEWNFSVENPDIGSALAFVYADMLEDTIGQLNRAGYKNELAFFNALGADLESAVPARGYAAFEIAEDAPEGAEVDAGMGMTASVEGREQKAQYETTEDIYVTPAAPSCLYLTDGRTDGIYQIAENLRQQTEPLVLFREKGANQQTHELYLTHEEVLEIFGEAYLELSFYAHTGQLLESECLEVFANPEIVSFSYWSKEGWQDFANVTLFQEQILLYKGKNQPPFEKKELFDNTDYVVRCKILDIRKAEKISVEEIRMKSRGERLAPQYIYGASVECDQQEYFPFGQRMVPFEEVYFGSKEVLGKRGANVSLSFYVDFAAVPLETNPEESPIEWKWVMKRSDFRPNPDFDISIEEVIWEYFNGNGWSRLFPGKEYSDVFGIQQGVLSRQRTIRFICPSDMTPILVNSCETCYIRARILKMNNLYKLKGQYIVPVLGNTTFAYSYLEDGRLPRLLGVSNNLEQSVFSEKEMGNWKQLFVGTEEMEKTLYLGFERPPVGAPVRMLWLLEDAISGQRGSLCWEYYGTKGWREMNLADGTYSLSRSGLVTFVGAEDFCRAFRFGRDLYWIRLRDESDFYGEGQGRKVYPVLKALWMNAVGIRHMERKETEWFTLDAFEENCCITLLHGNIDEISVRVWEGDGEEAALLLWTETSDLEAEPAGSRVYQVDRTAGVVYFGNGRHGKIPPFGKEDGIQISYKCGGGAWANAKPGQVNQLNQTLGFVQGVCNPESLWGGLDAETPKEAMRRCSAKLRHWNRAVTARDYEELAMEAARVLKKVRCFGGKNAEGEKESGAVTLVVLPEGDMLDKSQVCAVHETIYQYLISRMDPGIVKRKQFYVVAPKLVEIKVTAEVMIESFQEIFEVRRRVQERIKMFLDPMDGHFDGKGWDIGQFPAVMQIQNAIKEIPEIVQIRKVYMAVFISGPKGRQEADPDIISKHPYVLPVSGVHEVLVTVQGS